MTTLDTPPPPLPPTAPAPDLRADPGPGGGPVPHHRVAVIGAGFGGIGTVILLRRIGVTDVVVFERAGDVGGTWRDNTYPGCQCDIPTSLYSFSFAPNADWTRTYAPQPEIQAYLRQVADEHHVRRHVRFHHEVLDARWQPGERRWAIRTSGGDHTADVLVSAHGGLSHPSVPDLAGLDTFAGASFHSGAWDAGHDLRGERVAVIGTGASAVQIVPHVQAAAGHLSVFQRTPGWVLPRPDRPITPRRRDLFRRMPWLQRIDRAGTYLSHEAAVVFFAYRPELGDRIAKVGLAHLRRQVGDPDLRARLTPTFTPGCKRLLLSNDYYPALTRPNVDLVTAGIRSIGPAGITTDDGVEHELDTIILATGFAVTDHPITGVIHGLGGRSLRDAWAAGQRGYLGLTVPGFPNLFTLMGPNTALGHSSIVYMLESQIAYLASCLQQMDRLGLGVVDVSPSVAAAFDDEMQRRLGRSVWNTGGCQSWYLDEQGRNTTMWPGFTFAYRHRTRRFDLDRYHALPARPAPAAAGDRSGDAGVLVTADDARR
jgi:cation diffusion facilitator CzcD-associated flavoprotein CzcO